MKLNRKRNNKQKKKNKFYYDYILMQSKQSASKNTLSATESDALKQKKKRGEIVRRNVVCKECNKFIVDDTF